MMLMMVAIIIVVMMNDDNGGDDDSEDDDDDSISYILLFSESHEDHYKNARADQSSSHQVEFFVKWKGMIGFG